MVIVCYNYSFAIGRVAVPSWASGTHITAMSNLLHDTRRWRWRWTGGRAVEIWHQLPLPRIEHTFRACAL